MRKRSVQQFAIVSGDSAQSFTEVLNSKLMELEGKDITIDFYEHFFGARISWVERLEDLPECLRDEYEIKGAGFKCNQCPLYEMPLKADGTRDWRTKYGTCALKGNSRTFGERGACESLYLMIEEGKARLCLED